MSDPVIGVVTRRMDDEPRPALVADMSTILIIGPMKGADTKKFPLNTPVLGYSNDRLFLSKMGKEGFVPDAVRGINDQLGEAQFAATLIIVRTAHSMANDPATALREDTLGIIGDSLLGTGMWAGLRSADLLGKIPRIWLAPGYTGVLANSLGQLDTTTRGSGYVPGERYPVTFAGGGDNALLPVAYAEADQDGVLNDPVIVSMGGYLSTDAADELTATLPEPPAGPDAERGVLEVIADQLANPVTAAMDAVLAQYLAHGIVESAGTSAMNDNQWREGLNSQRLIPMVGGVKVIDPDTGAIVVRPVAPRVAGALVRRDFETGGPFYAACNQPIRGIVGPGRTINFNISNGDNEGQDLLRSNLGIVVRGDVGDDFAIASGGFILLATDNAGDDELWRFYNQTRGRDYIHILVTRTLRQYLGKYNITAHVIRAIVNTIDGVLQELVAKEVLHGARVGFAGATNSAEQIRQGQLTVAFKAEEPAPLRRIITQSSRYRAAIDGMVQQLEAQLNIAA